MTYIRKEDPRFDWSTIVVEVNGVKATIEHHYKTSFVVDGHKLLSIQAAQQACYWAQVIEGNAHLKIGTKVFTEQVSTKASLWLMALYFKYFASNPDVHSYLVSGKIASLTLLPRVIQHCLYEFSKLQTLDNVLEYLRPFLSELKSQEVCYAY